MFINKLLIKSILDDNIRNNDEFNKTVNKISFDYRIICQGTLRECLNNVIDEYIRYMVTQERNVFIDKIFNMIVYEICNYINFDHLLFNLYIDKILIDFYSYTFENMHPNILKRFEGKNSFKSFYCQENSSFKHFMRYDKNDLLYLLSRNDEIRSYAFCRKVYSVGELKYIQNNEEIYNIFLYDRIRSLSIIGRFLRRFNKKIVNICFEKFKGYGEYNNQKMLMNEIKYHPLVRCKINICNDNDDIDYVFCGIKYLDSEKNFNLLK